MLNVYELTIITKWVNCAARKMGWKVARGSSSQQQMARDSFWLCCNSCTAIIEGVTLVAQSWPGENINITTSFLIMDNSY